MLKFKKNKRKFVYTSADQKAILLLLLLLSFFSDFTPPVGALVQRL